MNESSISFSRVKCRTSAHGAVALKTRIATKIVRYSSSSLWFTFVLSRLLMYTRCLMLFSLQNYLHRDQFSRWSSAKNMHWNIFRRRRLPSSERWLSRFLVFPHDRCHRPITTNWDFNRFDRCVGMSLPRNLAITNVVPAFSSNPWWWMPKVPQHRWAEALKNRWRNRLQVSLIWLVRLMDIMWTRW